MSRRAIMFWFALAVVVAAWSSFEAGYRRGWDVRESMYEFERRSMWAGDSLYTMTPTKTDTVWMTLTMRDSSGRVKEVDMTEPIPFKDWGRP